MRYRLEVRLTPADVGQRVVIRWRPPSLDASGQMTDVLGILEEADDRSFAVRTRDQTLDDLFQGVSGRRRSGSA